MHVSLHPLEQLRLFLATKLDAITGKLDTLISMQPPQWTTDTFHGATAALVAGQNTLTVKPGGTVDTDPSGKRLKTLMLALDQPEPGDTATVVITDGANTTTIAENIPLGYSGKILEYTSPPEIPAGYWIEITVSVQNPKNIELIAELVG